jgi:hypothetical protein
MIQMAQTFTSRCRKCNTPATLMLPPNFRLVENADIGGIPIFIKDGAAFVKCRECGGRMMYPLGMLPVERSAPTPVRESKRGGDSMRPRPRRQSLSEAQRRHDLQYFRDNAIAAVQAFAEVYNRTRPASSEGLDTLASFHEAYERAQGETKTVERRLFTVKCGACEGKFKVQLPGSHRLVTDENGALKDKSTVAQAKCPHCDKKVTLTAPDGYAMVRSPKSGQDEGDEGALGMDSDREPDRGDTIDGDDGDEDSPEDDGEPLHRVRGDDGEDEEEDEDEEETEDDSFIDDDVATPPVRRGDPGTGSRDSLRRFYKKESNKRVREAAQTFLRTLNSIERYNRPVF